MKEHSQIQKFISVLMIFILLIYLSGCSTTKVISKSDLPFPDSNKYFLYPYVVHSEKSEFLLYNPKISNGIISGIFSTQKDTLYNDNQKIHLYLSSDSVIKIDKGLYLSVPMDKVTKVELKKPSAAKTTFLVLGCAALSVLLLSIIVYVTTPTYIDLSIK